MPHGLANAIILPYFLEEYGPACYGKLAKLARCIGMVPKHTNDRRVAAAFIQWIKDMNQYMKIPEPIQEIRKEDIPAMAKHVAAEGNPLYPVPVLMDAGELEIMYEKIIEKKEGKADAGKDSEAIGETKIAIARGKHPEVKGEYGTVIGLIVEDEKGKPVAAGVRNVDGIQAKAHQIYSMTEEREWVEVQK